MHMSTVSKIYCIQFLLFIPYRVEKFIVESIILVYRWHCPLCGTLSPKVDFYVYELVGMFDHVFVICIVIVVVLIQSSAATLDRLLGRYFEQLHKLTPTFAKAPIGATISQRPCSEPPETLFFNLDKFIIPLIYVLLSLTNIHKNYLTR